MNNDNFFSIDKLVEFGMGMAMAQQMVNMMNQSMQQMYVPGSIQTMPQPMRQTFYAAIEGRQTGPLNEQDLIRMVSEKRITKETLAWIPGMPSWKPVEEIPEILRVIATAPPPIPTT